VRLRALPLLLALTAADYALWHWSIAGGHDILSLISGLTLLPLAAATLALLALGAARLCGVLLEAAREWRAPATSRTTARRRPRTRASQRRSQPNPDAKPPARSEERGSRRLAA
jgi:hypothetical protein